MNAPKHEKKTLVAPSGMKPEGVEAGRPDKNGSANVILLIVAMIWGGGFVAGKVALEGFSPVAVVFTRFFGSAVLFGALFWRRIRTSDRRMMVAGGVIGGVQFLSQLVQIVALQYTTAMKQSFLAATYVVFTPFMAWLVMRARPRGRDVLVALLAMIGVGLISLTDRFTLQLGDALTLVFAVLFSLQIVLIQKLAHDLDSIPLNFFQFASAGVLSLAGMLLTRTTLIPTNTGAVAGLAYIVVINTALAFCLQTYAQKRTDSNRAALLLSLESVFGFAFSALYYKTPISLKMIAGCALVLAAVFLSKAGEKKTGLNCG